MIDHGLSRAEDAVTVERLMTVLGERERLLLRLRFARTSRRPRSPTRLGISQMHVSRLIRQSIARLQVAAGETPSPSGRSRTRSPAPDSP